MLIRAFSEGFNAQSLVQLILLIPIILISLTVHEYSHGFAAFKCGDMTARNLGRLTLNPIKHLDPIGTIMMLLFGFGYAKPVPINPRNFGKPRRDICIVSVAGPLSNLLLGFFGLMLFRLSAHIVVAANASAVYYSGIFQVWLMFCQMFVFSNLGLCVFNLIPIPPLDGSRLLSVILPPKIAFTLAKYEQYIMLVVLALLYFGRLDGIISFCSTGILNGMNWLLDFIPIF